MCAAEVIHMYGTLRNMASIYIVAGDKMLLLWRVGSRVVAPSWCGVGGHFEKEELNNARAAVLRELKEEIGLHESDIKNLSLRYLTLRLKKGEIRQNYYFFADLADGVTVKPDCDEGVLEWTALSELGKREMPFIAKYVLKHYIEKGRYDNLLYGGVACETGVEFVPLEEF